MVDPQDTDVFDEINRAFYNLSRQTGEYAGLMLNYAFYFIKNILSYKLVRMMGDKSCQTYDVIESVAGFKACVDICAGQGAERNRALTKPGARVFLSRIDEEGAKRFLDSIFIILEENAYGDIRTLFYDCTGKIINEAEDAGELGAFIKRYVNASMAYRPEIFGPWAAGLLLSVTNVKSLVAKQVEDTLKQSPHDIDVKKTGYQIKKTVAENILLTDELSDIFKKIPEYRAAGGESGGTGEDAEIMDGICETINIKLESLTENKNEYRLAMDRLAEGYARDFPSMDADDIKAVAGEIFARLADAADGGPGLSAGSFYDLIAATEAYGAFKEKVCKYMERMRETCLKRDYTFKRDCLLYEISTYGEIMNYSVSRLKESAAERAGGFTAVCESVLDEISVQIQKNNITAINPAPYEMFNGKEHEVLLAEEHEHFAKGSIIKVINPGYRYGDMILARATVIAAK